jgi:phosphohistidine swiveling domain-containing protein
MIVISVDSYEVTKNFQKSVIQTNKDMTTLKIRQLPGKALGKGIIRGKVIKVNSLSELQKDSENSIVVMSEILESENFAKVKGLITGQSTIPMQIENTLKSNSIPTIFGLGNLIDSIKSGDELTINELLDLVIFHELKY